MAIVELCAGYAFLAALAALFAFLWRRVQKERDALKKKLGKRIGDIRTRGEE